MKKYLLILFMIFIPLLVSAESGKKTAVYFYADWCPHCQKVNDYFTEQGFYEKYDIQKLNFDEPENKALLQKIFTFSNYKGAQGIPAIIIDNNILTGDADIISNFQKNIENSKGTVQDFINKARNQNNSKLDLSILVLLPVAFADAANPCALAVLILLLATVINAKGKNYALLSGLMFSLAIFISYFLMGIGAYRAITAFNISKYLSLGAGILAIIIALANFKDVFWYGKVFIMEVPLGWRPKMQNMIKKATSPWSAFGIGFLVSLFLVPCASGPYVAILAKLAEKVDVTKTLFFLVLYNLIFVSPMIIITLAMYFFNTRMRKLEEVRQKNLQLLHLIIGIIMLLLGIYLIYSRV